MFMLRRYLIPVALMALLVLPTVAFPAPHANAQDCGGAPAPRLTTGQTARVTLTDGTGNNLRASAATDATVLGVLADGEIVSVIAGPQCAANLYWWQVRRWDGQTGWTAEGDASGYWLEPWPVAGAQLAPGTRPNLPDLQIAFLSGYEGYVVPHIIAADGSGLQIRGELPAAENRVIWSPDGTQIAFTDIDNTVWVLGQFDALRVSPQGTVAGWPSFAPDGGQIVFEQAQEDDVALVIYDLATNSTANLTNTAGLNIQPAWSPDGQRIAFASDREGNFDLYVINADGSGLARVTATPGDEGMPVWSPDGQYIAYTLTEDEQTRLAVTAPGGQPVVFPAPGVQGIPAWSPDGERIVYAAETPPDSGQVEVFSIRADGQDRFQYTTNGGRVAGVTWSPGGEWIVFADDSSGNFDLYALRPNGTGIARLTENPGLDAYPTFQPPTTPDLPDESASAIPTPTTPASAPGAEDLLLIYDAAVPVFTLQNTSGQPLDLRPLTFVGGTISVPASIWAEYTASPLEAFKANGCLMVWGFGLEEQPAPPECGDARQAWVTNDRYIFWTLGSFDVRYGDATVATCDTAAGRCTVDLP